MIFRPEFLTPLVSLVPGAVALGAGVARRRELGRPGVALDLLPPEGAEVDLNAWLRLFQSLYGISRPWWKRCFIGQPWLGLELRAKDGLVWARCWCPEPIEGLVSAHLRETVPGVQVREAEEDDIGAAPAARTRLKLALEPIHSVGATKPDAMARITGLLSGTQDAWVQVVISPDVTWQRRARRRLEQLAGADSLGSMPLRLLSGLVGEVFGIFWASRGGEVPPKRSTSTHWRGARETGADKAALPGWAAEIRVRVAADTQSEANLRMRLRLAVLIRKPDAQCFNIVIEPTNGCFLCDSGFTRGLLLLGVCDISGIAADDCLETGDRSSRLPQPQFPVLRILDLLHVGKLRHAREFEHQLQRNLLVPVLLPHKPVH